MQNPFYSWEVYKKKPTNITFYFWNFYLSFERNITIAVITEEEMPTQYCNPPLQVMIFLLFCTYSLT